MTDGNHESKEKFPQINLITFTSCSVQPWLVGNGQAGGRSEAIELIKFEKDIRSCRSPAVGLCRRAIDVVYLEHVIQLNSFSTESAWDKRWNGDSRGQKAHSTRAALRRKWSRPIHRRPSEIGKCARRHKLRTRWTESVFTYEYRTMLIKTEWINCSGDRASDGWQRINMLISMYSSECRSISNEQIIKNKWKKVCMLSLMYWYTSTSTSDAARNRFRSLEYSVNLPLPFTRCERAVEVTICSELE